MKINENFEDNKLRVRALNIKNELGPSCAKLSTGWASYLLAISYVRYTKTAYQTPQCLFSLLQLRYKLPLVGLWVAGLSEIKAH